MSNNFIAMTKCYYCNESKDILIDTRMKDITELHNMVVDKEPCSKCAEYMKQGILIISVRTGEPQSENPFRTGGFFVLKEASFSRIFNKLPPNRWTFMEHDVCVKIGLMDKTEKDLKIPPVPKP